MQRIVSELPFPPGVPAGEHTQSSIGTKERTREMAVRNIQNTKKGQTYIISTNKTIKHTHYAGRGVKLKFAV